jgi:hypothetical protein
VRKREGRGRSPGDGFVYFIFEEPREGVQSRAAMASNTMHLWKVERRVGIFEVSRIGR